MEKAAAEPLHPMRGRHGTVSQNAGSTLCKMRKKGLLRA
jgi:hypothetical protein